jgi:hypothetical protein
MSGARQTLEEPLNAVGESSQFVTSGGMAPVLPGLEVKGVGAIGSPVAPADAQRLIVKATQAPYGRGEATIVDTDVRRVWQIEPSQFTLRNSEWETVVSAIVDAVKREFGIHQKVSATLYKLLIYEKGSFFAPHRDSEKASGMFATMVVSLPSRHEGGTLVVTHDGQTKKIDFGGKDSEFQMRYAAFYADCQHEITPVSAGYRICLVYNLAIAGKKRQPAAPQNAPAVEKVAQQLNDLFADESSKLSKMAIPLEHQYTEAGLDPKQLKGSDRACFDILLRAAESLDYQCHLALLTHHQSGEVDYDTWGYDRYRSRRSYRWSDEEDEDVEDSPDSGAEMGEVYEEEMTLDHWLDPLGGKPQFGEMKLEKSEVLSQEGQEGWSIRQEVHEATGNEGVSLERWYRQGAIVIWPRDRYFRILAGEGQGSAIPSLEKVAAGAKKPTALAACRTFAEEVIGQWKPRQSITGGGSSWSARMLTLLERIGTAELVQRFIRDVLPKDFDGTEGKALLRLFQRFGWESFAIPIQDFLAHPKPTDHFTRLDQIVSICEALCCDSPALTQERRVFCASLADPLVQVVERWDAAPTVAWYRQMENRAGVVAGVVRIFATIPAPEHLDRFITHVLKHQRDYGLREVLIPDVKAIDQWIAKVPAAQPAASRLLEHCLAALRAATAQPVTPPKDWARDAEMSCKCEDCRALVHFLRDPAQRVGRFPLRKERRQHLHQQIDKHRLDLTHVTERQGSPQTLVCTKTQASYELRLKQFEIDQKLLADVEAIASRERPSAVRRAPAPRKSKK